MSRRPAQRSACLGPVAVDYVHGVLPPAKQLDVERHLVGCVPCRRSVDTERRLDAALRGSVPEVPDGLRRMLMSMSLATDSLGSEPVASQPFSSEFVAPNFLAPQRLSEPAGSTAGPAESSASRPLPRSRVGMVPDVPRAPKPVRSLAAPLPVVDVGAPAQHRSAMRSAICAGLAAGASAAAALSLGIAGGPPIPSTPAISGAGGDAPVNRTVSGTATPSRAVGPRAALTAFTASGSTFIRPTVSTSAARSAQSTP